MRMMTTMVAAALLTACDFDLGADFDAELPMTQSDAQTSVTQGRIDGRLGRFDVQTNDVYGYAGGWDRSTFVDLRGRSDSGVLMTFVQMEGVDLNALEVGDTIETMGYDGDWMEDEFAMVIACAGEEDDQWEEDVPVEDGEIEVEEKNEDEGTITMGVEGRLPNGEALKAQFTLDLDEMALVQ